VCKIEKGGPLAPFAPLSCWHIDEETCLPIGVDIRKPPQLEGETCPLGTDYIKNHPLLEPQLLPQLHEKIVCETKSVRVGLETTTFINVWTPLIDNTMSIRWHKDYRARDRRTWVCSCET
jgi:hypothetical protein